MILGGRAATPEMLLGVLLARAPEMPLRPRPPPSLVLLPQEPCSLTCSLSPHLDCFRYIFLAAVKALPF